MTGYGQPEDVARGLEAGFDHYLVKPVGLDALLPLSGPWRRSRPAPSGPYLPSWRARRCTASSMRS